MAVANPALYVWLEGQQEREKGHPNPAGSPMGIPIRWEPGNRGKTPDRAVGSPGHLGHLTGRWESLGLAALSFESKELRFSKQLLEFLRSHHLASSCVVGRVVGAP